MIAKMLNLSNGGRSTISDTAEWLEFQSSLGPVVRVLGLIAPKINGVSNPLFVHGSDCFYFAPGTVSSLLCSVALYSPTIDSVRRQICPPCTIVAV